jgi:hypothetical protein
MGGRIGIRFRSLHQLRDHWVVQDIGRLVLESLPVEHPDLGKSFLPDRSLDAELFRGAKGETALNELNDALTVRPASTVSKT